MSRRSNQARFTTSKVEKKPGYYCSLLAGQSHIGKTYSYLDFLRDPAMKGKKMLILASDTVANIEKNLALNDFDDIRDRVEILSDLEGKPVQITKNSKFAEAAVEYAVDLIKKDNSYGAVALDNYDNLEEMYINEESEAKEAKGLSPKLMGYDYGIPRNKVYFKCVKPFIVIDNIHFFMTVDIKEIYMDDKPTGTYDMNLPLKRRKHFSEWIWMEKKYEGTAKETLNTTITKWKGIQNPLVIGDVNKFTEVIGKVKESM